MATLNIDNIEIGDILQKSLEGSVKEMVRKAIDEVAADPLQRKDYLNKREACDFLGVSFTTLQRLEVLGLPIIHIEGKQLISKETLKSFLKTLEK